MIELAVWQLALCALGWGLCCALMASVAESRVFNIRGLSALLIIALGPVSIATLLVIALLRHIQLMGASVWSRPPARNTLLEDPKGIVWKVEWTDWKWDGTWEGELSNQFNRYADDREFCALRFRYYKPHTPPQVAGILNRAGGGS